MAESTTVRVKRDSTIAFQDAGAETYTVAYEPGDENVDIPRETIVHNLDRGVIPTVPSIRLGDDQPMSITFTVYERDISSTTDATMMDIATRPSGSYVASNWTSTIGNSSDEFTVSMTLTVDGVSFGEADKTLTFPYCSVRASRAGGDPNTVSVTVTSYANIYTVS